MMLNSLDWLVILFMGLASVSMLSLALMFLSKNKIVRYVTMGTVLAAAGIAAFFGFMVGITGYFIGQLAIALMAGLLVAGAVALGEKYRLVRENEGVEYSVKIDLGKIQKVAPRARGYGIDGLVGVGVGVEKSLERASGEGGVGVLERIINRAREHRVLYYVKYTV